MIINSTSARIISLCLISGSLALTNADWAAAAIIDQPLFDSSTATFRAQTSAASAAPTACANDNFSHLRKDLLAYNSSVNISIVFGYNDQRPYVAVIDSLEIKTLTEGLMKPCLHSTDQLCGFEKGNDGHLRKTVELEKGQRIPVDIELVASSASGDDNWNKTTGQAWQAPMSAYAKNRFLTTLQTNDIVFYTGHARNGGGPDFFPPVLRADGQVYLKQYEEQKVGITNLLTSLRPSASLKFLGLFACNADAHFASQLIQTRPDIQYALAKEITLPSAMNPAMWATLHQILSPSCTTLQLNVPLVAIHNRR